MAVQIIIGDALEQLALLPSESVNCCISSPPYFGLRDYGVAGQIGLEASPDEYVARMVDVFREVRRVLRADGTVWLNLGDSYCAPGGGFKPDAPSNLAGSKQARTHPHATNALRSHINYGCKPKDLLGIPWLLAFGLRADGWYLRQDIIWAKPNPMPESVTDRCTKAHEYVFLLSKSARYYFDPAAIAEAQITGKSARYYGTSGQHAWNAASGGHRDKSGSYGDAVNRNRRSVWTVASEPYAEAHFATYPPALIEPCILAGTSERGVCAACGAPHVRVVERTAMVLDRSSRTHELGRTRSSGTMLEPPAAATIGWQPACTCDAATVPAIVLDPFSGAGTTGLVADRLGRNAVLIELNPAYAAMARSRIESDAGLFAEVAAPPAQAMPLQEPLL